MLRKCTVVKVIIIMIIIIMMMMIIMIKWEEPEAIKGGRKMNIRKLELETM